MHFANRSMITQCWGSESCNWYELRIARMEVIFSTWNEPRSQVGEASRFAFNQGKKNRDGLLNSTFMPDSSFDLTAAKLSGQQPRSSLKTLIKPQIHG
jgi:hypothetical protein